MTCPAHQDIEIPMPMPNPANLSRGSSRFALAGLKKRQKRHTTTALLAQCVRPPVGAHVVVTLTRVAYRGRMDSDGICFSFKAVRDAIAEWMGRDDRDCAELRWEYSKFCQQTTRPKFQGARIQIDVVGP